MMTWRDILISLCVNLFAGVLIFLLGLTWPIIPKSYRMWKLLRFWGRGVLGDLSPMVHCSTPASLTQLHPRSDSASASTTPELLR